MTELNEILTKIDRDYYAVDDQRDATNEDLRFCDVDGAMYEDWLDDQFANRPKPEFNKVGKQVHKFTGEWENNRFDVRFKPDDGVSSKEDAELLNGLYRKDFRRSDGPDAVDNAVTEMAKGGFSAFRLKTEFLDDEDLENNLQRIVWEPIYNAYSSVIFDANAKRYSKIDAKHVTYLEQLTREAAVEEWGEKVDSAFDPPNQRRFQWSSTKMVWIGHFYEVRIDKTEAITFKDPLGGTKTIFKDEFKAHLDDLADSGFEEVSRKKIKRRSIWKTIISGSEILEEAVRIPGKFLPIIPMYAYRSYVDGQEYWYGLVRKKKDANRLFNMGASGLMEAAATTSKDMPIFTAAQVEGRENTINEIHLGAHNHLVINDLFDNAGNPMPPMPAGVWAASRVDANSAAVMQMTSDFIREESNGNIQEVNDLRMSGRALNEVKQSADIETFPIMNNIAKSLAYSGKVYRSMAADVYDSQRVMNIIDRDGGEDTTILFDIVIDKETGKAKYINDVTKGSFEVFVDMGPTFASRKEATVSHLLELIPLVEGEERGFLISEVIQNTEGEGLDDFKEFNKRRMLERGQRQPETPEEEEFVRQIQEQQQGGQQDLIEAMTENQRSEGINNIANAQKNATQAELNTAKRAEIIQGIDMSRFQQTTEITGQAASQSIERVEDDLDKLTKLADIESTRANTRKTEAETAAQLIEIDDVTRGIRELISG